MNNLHQRPLTPFFHRHKETLFWVISQNSSKNRLVSHVKNLKSYKSNLNFLRVVKPGLWYSVVRGNFKPFSRFKPGAFSLLLVEVRLCPKYSPFVRTVKRRKPMCIKNACIDYIMTRAEVPPHHEDTKVTRDGSLRYQSITLMISRRHNLFLLYSSRSLVCR